jgi:hypothetical protein
LPPPFGPTNRSLLWDERGGRLDQHIERWKALAASGQDVEIGGLGPSACTLVLAHVPKERLCFNSLAVLGFHLARFPNGEPAIEASRAMFNAYPKDIRMWLQEKGGVEKMPLESLWLLFPSELWQMGYRRCVNAMPEPEQRQRALEDCYGRSTGVSQEAMDHRLPGSAPHTSRTHLFKRGRLPDAEVSPAAFGVGGRRMERDKTCGMGMRMALRRMAQARHRCP